MGEYDDALEFVDVAYKRAGFDAGQLTPAVRNVHLINRIQSEVICGGFLQWLTNTSGRYAAETIEAFEKVDAPRCAAIVRSVTADFPGGMPAKDDMTRLRQTQRLLSNLRNSWVQAENHLLNWPDDIDALLRRYVESHAADFAGAH